MNPHHDQIQSIQLIQLVGHNLCVCLYIYMRYKEAMPILATEKDSINGERREIGR
jgi:hypothetical protein